MSFPSLIVKTEKALKQKWKYTVLRQWSANVSDKWLKVLGVQCKPAIHESRCPTAQNGTSSSAEIAGVQAQTLPKHFWIWAVKGRGSLSMALNDWLIPMWNGMEKRSKGKKNEWYLNSLYSYCALQITQRPAAASNLCLPELSVVKTGGTETHKWRKKSNNSTFTSLIQ